MSLRRKESKIVMSGNTLFVELTLGEWAEVSPESMEAVRGFTWRLLSDSYAIRDRRLSDGPGPRLVYMHRAVFEHHVGREIDPALTIDHKDRDKLNNRVENLREASIYEQGFNIGLKSNNTSGFRGVSWDKRDRKWRAHVMVAGKQKSLGYFEHKEDAIRARQEFDRSNYLQIQPEEVTDNGKIQI